MKTRVPQTNDHTRHADKASGPAQRVADRRPETLAQSRLQAVAAASPQTRQLQALQQLSDSHAEALAHKAPVALSPQRAAPQAPEHALGGTVQLTSWEHDGTQWVMKQTSTADNDIHPDPTIAYPHACLGDTYDQQTGVHTTPIRDHLALVGQSTGAMGFYDKRATTGYRYASGKKRQGPHTFGHISKRVAMAAAVNAGRDPLKLRGSPAFPRPRRANKMLRDRLALRGPNWQKTTRKLRTQYLKQYTKFWLASKNAKTLVARRDALRRGMELNPATVYNIGKGTTSAAEISGKGENRKKGASDVGKLLDTSGKLTSANGLSTMDLSGATAQESEEALRMAQSFRDVLQRDDADEDSGDSESDSELELEE